MRKIWIGLLLALPFVAHNHVVLNQPPAPSRPVVSFTFDDGKTTSLGGYELSVWNNMILHTLSKHRLKAILFVAGHNKRTNSGKYVLRSWNDAGHRIANHTLNHPDFSNDAVTLDQFKQELLANDSLIRKYSNYMRCFRFPYLKEGNTPEKVNGFRSFMRHLDYRTGHVTIDASDWYIDSRLRKRLESNPLADISSFRSFYIQHIYEHALYYDSLAVALTGRHINHSLLLHHNLSSALFLDDLIAYFKSRGWVIMDADKAYEDEVYNTVTQTLPAGESLIWSMARQSGKFDLRYPAEGDQYEKAKMDSLGL
jgi:peptidoglycan-N-acetylglucosamine deacetylase